MFAATVLVGTIALGVILSVFIGPSVSIIAELINKIPNFIWVLVYVSVIFTLLLWGVFRCIKITKHKKISNKSPAATKWLQRGLFIVALVFIISTLLDPSYLALIALAGHDNTLLNVILAHSFWIIISQLPLFIFSVAVLLNTHKRLLKWFQKFWTRHGGKVSVFLTLVIFIVAGVLIVDLFSYLTRGEWLL